MLRSLLAAWVLFFSFLSNAATISGTIRSANENKPLSFSSILIKGTTKGVSANKNGFYTINLEPGTYTLVCQFVGYTTLEKKIKVEGESIIVDFDLTPRQYDLKDVTVKSGGEDPAYAIIRKAIASREEHLREIKQFSCEVYIKGQLQLRNYPTSFFGQKVDFEDGDTSKRKMLFLSETIAKYSVEEPNKRKIEVISTKVSGRSDGFGFSSPQIISFYENTISVGRSLNPRGFISPIANNALNYYKYKFEGTFFEFGKEVSRIKVIPKRPYEPLFSGYINISENDWRIQSVDLKLLKAQQMQLLDTLVIQQNYIPAGKYWVIKNQVIYPSGKFFGFDFFGNFLQVYDQFNLEPAFKSKYFDNTILKFYDSSNKKSAAYWDSIRPLPLMVEEARDYQKKDSLEQVRKDPAYLDSLDKKNNKITLVGLLLTGQSFGKQKNKTNISFDPIIQSLNYNTVEGGVIQFSPSFSKSYEGRKSISITPTFRYGFANRHFNPSIAFNYNFGKKYIQSLSVAGGRKLFQYNNAEPIGERLNSLYTLTQEYNYFKIYEADFFRIGYSQGVGSGLNLSANFQFQNRYALDNLADMTNWSDKPDRQFTPNYPTELTNTKMINHQAAILTFGISWRPGSKYVEFPDRKVSLGSRYPTINASVTQGIKGLFGSDVDYTRWRLSVNDQLNLKLYGRFNYNLIAGGFLRANKTFIPDYHHFLGNQTALSSNFLNSFQLAGYYRYSNTATFNAAIHIEHHLNGFISNKIPGFKKLNWFFVTGANGLYLNNGTNYFEYFIGLENVFKVMRIDFVQGFEQTGLKPSGFRFSVPLVR
jgi:hypothetical protein